MLTSRLNVQRAGLVNKETWGVALRTHGFIVLQS